MNMYIMPFYVGESYGIKCLEVERVQTPVVLLCSLLN